MNTLRFLLALASAMVMAVAPARANAGTLAELLAEALQHNPELAAARAGSEAAQQRVSYAAALEDPMLEAGIVNAPLPFSLRREDMTMKMLGLAQKLPFPGKRALRHDVAAADASSIAHAVDETADRVLRDVRAAYGELQLDTTARSLVSDTLVTLQQLESVAEARIASGQATQGDALQAQIELVTMQQELLRLDQEQQMRRSELGALLGRDGDGAPIIATPAQLLVAPGDPQELIQAAQARRPQLRALAAMLERSDAELALARREYYPDFELRLGYGQRDRTLAGMPRDDMVTLTVAVNLQLWRSSRQAPRVAEAAALRRQAASLIESQRLDTRASLERELATVTRQRASARLLQATLKPQAQAAYESALSAYRVGSVDFMTLLQARMRMYETERGAAEAIAAHNRAIAEVDFLAGRRPDLVGNVEASP